MISYRIGEDELRQRIEAFRPGWLARAQARTQSFLAAGASDETSSIWSDIKPVFMELQHDKCAFCERQLAAADYGGAIEHDLEHFRPKKDVKAWPANPGTGGNMPSGYYWLAYEPLNYATACKQCNSALKASYFPIAGPRGAPPAGPRDLLTSERPWLAFPIGDRDEPAEQLVTFDGIMAVPAAPPTDVYRHRRGVITIEFFALNARERLLEGRARDITQLWVALAMLATNASTDSQALAHESVQHQLRAARPHVGACRAFFDAYQRDRARASVLVRGACDYLDKLYA